MGGYDGVATAQRYNLYTEFELDSDVLEEGEHHQHLRRPTRDMPSRRNAASPMPLLVGLADRRSMDVSLPLMADGDLRSSHDDGVRVDLDELAERKNKGGGMLDSIANMANSILGAGVCIVLTSVGSSPFPNP